MQVVTTRLSRGRQIVKFRVMVMCSHSDEVNKTNAYKDITRLTTFKRHNIITSSDMFLRNMKLKYLHAIVVRQQER